MVRMNTQEKRKLDKLAKAAGLPPSTYLRWLMMKAQ